MKSWMVLSSLPTTDVSPLLQDCIGLACYTDKWHNSLTLFNREYNSDWRLRLSPDFSAWNPQSIVSDNDTNLD